MLQEAMRQTGLGRQLPVEVRPSVLFNPGSRSPNFFVPGMIAVVLQMMLITLTALSVVRERERGTLEQLSLTPVTPLGLMTGKMLPYGMLGFVELCAILLIMRVVFDVPVNGSPLLLLALSLPFLVTALGLGLLISTKARTQAEAFQMSVGTLLPSVFLSGYIFLIENMPTVFQVISHAVPATYYIRILRGVILRGADLSQLWDEGLVLSVMGCAAIGLAALQFVRRRA
jgi:ABC-2 type transport system permease protein